MSIENASTLKKIMLISNSSSSMISFRIDFIRSLHKAGYQVLLVCLLEGKGSIKALTEEGCEVIIVDLNPTSKNPLQDIKYCSQLYKIIKEKSPDIILNYTIKPIIYGSFAARLAGVRSIYSLLPGLGNIFTNQNLKTKSIRLIVMLLYKIALLFNQKVFFLNPDDQAEFLKRKLVPSNKQVILNGEGLPLNRFPYAKPQASLIRFLMIARLVREKGVLEFLQAAEIIKAKYPQTLFSLIGPLNPKYPQAITQTELSQFEHIVNCVGFVNDVTPFIKEASVFVLPSYREGTPRSVLEAMAIGRAIITTNVPGCRQTVIDGKNGFLIPSKNVEALVDKMEYFILHKEAVEKMGLESRRLVEEKFDVHKVNEILFKTILGR